MLHAARKTVTRRLSVAEYLAGPTDGPRSELINGELVVPPAPREGHQDIAHHLGQLLWRWTDKFGLGKVAFDIDMVLSEKEAIVYRPDLLFVARAHASRRREGRIYGPADLCIEVLSPSDRPRVLRRKHEDYARFGVPWYWIINPLPEEPVVEENELWRGAYRVRSEIVGDKWFSPVLFPDLHFRLLPLAVGDLRSAVKGKAKRIV